MRDKMRAYVAATIMLAAVALPTRCLAQEHNQRLPQYTVLDLGTLGGTFSSANGISNSGWVSGISTLPGDTVVHAFLWRNGVMTDLGTLGGSNSLTFFKPNDSGDLGGGAETSTPDPLGEDPCGNHLICLPVVWQGFHAAPLPTLGGNNGFAQETNNRGELVGTAENTTQDPNCEPPQVLQQKPVIWEKGEVYALPMYPGDTVGAAHAINDRGQATGWSGKCARTDVGFAGFHALLWQNGTATYLGSLGGTLNTQGLGINNRSQVAGYGDLAGDTTYHAFLWQNGVMSDLGTLPGDVASGADGLNDRGQVVGGSFDAASNGRAFIWQNGIMTDLNTLIPPNSPLYLLEAMGVINDRGQIAGYAVQISTGEVHAFLATPNGSEALGEGTAIPPAGESVQRPNVILPEIVRKWLQQRQGLGGFGTRMIEPQ
jgi:probable HAF family extracellular repeat protein